MIRPSALALFWGALGVWSLLDAAARLYLERRRSHG